jgi:hypothetical protein
VPDQADYDSPWKDVLDLFFADFMAFFFPSAHAQIDWARGFEFLDKELQKITADAALGRRVVDKLVKVWLTTGQELWVLIHIEVQGERETGFALRVYVYHYRIFDRFNRPVATFVILADEEANWRPDSYRQELLGTEVNFKFPAVKLLDYRQRWDELEQSDSPFAVVVQAQLTAQQTRDDARGRLEQKFELTKRLYERGWDEQQVIGLFQFLDWLLRLPLELEAEFHDKLDAYEEEKEMPYVTSIERIGIEKGKLLGREEGRQEGITAVVLRQLQRRVGALDEATQTQICALSRERLEALSDALLDFATRSDLEVWLQQHSLPA